jgi:hypothetical protein
MIMFKRASRLKLALSGFLVVVVVLVAFMWVAAIKAETETGPPQLLGPDNWPVTVEEAVRDLLPRLSWYQKLNIKLMKKEDTTSLHHGFGTGLRNRYGLWRGNDKLILSACGYPCHPDDASAKIIEAVWDELHK